MNVLTSIVSVIIYGILQNLNAEVFKIDTIEYYCVA